MASTEDADGMPLRIFVFDNMRARSHLFFRWLSTSPELAPIQQPFIMTAFLGADRFTQHTRGSDRRIEENNVDMVPLYGNDTYESCRVAFEDAVNNAEMRGKIPFANDHWFNVLKQDVLFDFLRKDNFQPSDMPQNPTHLPDWYFDSMRPIIVIRNPLIQIPSNYDSMVTMSHCRPGDEDFEITTTLRFCKLLFDHFRSQGKEPILVDAEDIVWRTDDLAASICSTLGIDTSQIKDKWDPIPEEERPKNPVLRAWTKTILESNGIERPAEKPKEPTMEASFQRLTKKFGDEGAKQVRELVEANMPYYEYLIQFKA